MDINEQKRRINNFMLTFSENVYGVRKNPFEIIGEYLSKLLEAPKTYSCIIQNIALILTRLTYNSRKDIF
jgi:hypothetical protein